MNLLQNIKMIGIVGTLLAAPALLAQSASPVSPASPASPVSPAAPASPVSPASPASPVSPASPASVASPASAEPTRAEKIKAAKDEIARRFAGRRAEAARTLAELTACAGRMREGQARREAEKAITNLQSALGKADAEAAKGIYRAAFVALGRPAKAAQAALRRCQQER